MRYVVQAPTGLKLSGRRYEQGDPVPPDLVTQDLLIIGAITAVPEPAVEALAAGAGRYDPGQHTVEHVVEYAAGHPDQAGEIAEAERAGGNRSTLLDRLDEIAAAHRERQAQTPDDVAAPVGGLPGSHLPAPGVTLDIEPGPVGEPSDPANLEVEVERREVPSDHLAFAEDELRAAEKAAAVGEPSDPADAKATRREVPGDHLAADEAASASLTDPPQPARGATAEDIGPDATERMRAKAGTDPAGDPDPSAPLPAREFNPSEHTVAEVLAYVEAHPDQTLIVGRAEQTGKARRGLLAELDRRAQEGTAP